MKLQGDEIHKPVNIRLSEALATTEDLKSLLLSISANDDRVKKAVQKTS